MMKVPGYTPFEAKLQSILLGLKLGLTLTSHVVLESDALMANQALQALVSLCP